jgi:hypothetical protein
MSANSPPFSPIDLSAEPIDLRSEPIDLKPEDVRYPSWEPTARKRPRALARFSIAFCTGIAGTLLWQSYGDAARQVIANLYPQLGWLTPRDAATVQKAPDTIALSGSAATYPDQKQLDVMLGDLHPMRLSLDRIDAGQELITRSIDEIATRIAAGQEQITRSADQTATGITAGQEPTRRSTNQTAATTGQKQMTGNTDQTATSVDQAPSESEAARIPAESRGDAASLRPTVRLNIKPTEARPPQTLSERGKQASAASGGHDASCFPSASAVLQNHPGGWPTWTLKAPGYEGTMCWHAAARPRGSDHRPTASDHRRETTPEKEIGTTENGLFAPSAPRGRAEGLP